MIGRLLASTLRLQVARLAALDEPGHFTTTIPQLCLAILARLVVIIRHSSSFPFLLDLYAPIVVSKYCPWSEVLPAGAFVSIPPDSQRFLPGSDVGPLLGCYFLSKYS